MKKTQIGDSTDPDTLAICSEVDEISADTLAAAALEPEIRAGQTVNMVLKSQFGDLGLSPTIKALQSATQSVREGSMAYLEDTLVAQISTLDAVFHKLLKRGLYCERIDQFRAEVGLAMKAQRQCALTASVLAELKNPSSATFIKQANVAHQQVVQNGDPPRAQEIWTRHNELKGISHEPIERMDPGASSTASREDPAMATVGEIDRTKNQAGKGQKRRQSQG